MFLDKKLMVGMKVFCGHRVDAKREAALVHHLPLETLVAFQLVYAVRVTLLAFLCQRMVGKVLLTLVEEAVCLTLLTLQAVDVGVMVLLYQGLQPVAIGTSVVLLRDKVKDGLHVLVKGILLFLWHQRYTGLVALPFCAPVIRIDGELTYSLDVHAHITDAEIHMSQGRNIVLANGHGVGSDECCYFHDDICLFD